MELRHLAVSQQIRRLEYELGVEVFRRTSRSVELTSEGQVILGYARRVLAEVDGMRTELEELSGLLRGHLRIGGVYPTGPYDLFGLLADFRSAHPGVAIHMVETTQDDVLAALRADELDCAFAALDPDALGDEFAATLLFEEEIVVALPIDHALCESERVTFEELAGEDMAAVRGLASKGLGVAVIPRSVAEQPGPPIELRPIGPERLTWPIALVWRVARHQTPAGKAFITVALEYAKRAEGLTLQAA